MPDINILVASLGLGHFSWLKDSKMLAFIGHSFPGPRHFMYVPISRNCLLPKTNVPEVMNRNTVFREKDTDLKRKHLPRS